jgi:CRISPR-associated protein Cas5h
MPKETLISFDLKADFGVFKKPDVNDGLQITFNMLHKPALLGILGAIAGLKGYEKKGVFPEYWEKLKDLRVGIAPLDHENGNFTKTVIKYTNTVGYANADGNLLITEQTLRKPAYRCYLLLDLENEAHERLHTRIHAGEAEYLPYFGKNECSAWWDVSTVKTWKTQVFEPKNDFRVDSTFIRQYPVRSQKVEPRFSFSQRGMLNASSFAYFERLPMDFSFVEPIAKMASNQSNLFEEAPKTKNFRNENLNFVQYNLAEFAFTDWVLQKDSIISDLYEIESIDHQKRVIQLY